MTTQPSSVNVRVSKQTHQQLTALTKQNGLFMQTILESAVEAYRRQSFLEALNTEFAALQARTEEWTEELTERKLWEQTPSDGNHSKTN
jgi:hypothetical protein